MEEMTVLEFSDQELRVLNDIVRSHKVSVSNEELVLLLMGKKTSPLVSVTIKVGTAFEKKVAKTAAKAQEVAETEAKQELA